VVARRARALLQGGLDLGVTPIADTGVAIGSDVGRDRIERGLVEAQSAGLVFEISKLAGRREKSP